MDLKGKLFYRKKINYEKLIPFGFSYSNNIYYYKKDIAKGDFILKIDIVDGKLSYKVFGDSSPTYRRWGLPTQEI